MGGSSVSSAEEADLGFNAKARKVESGIRGRGRGGSGSIECDHEAHEERLRVGGFAVRIDLCR